MPQIDQNTLGHLICWLANQFGDEGKELMYPMLCQYGRDPEHYDNAGWWRCYDDMRAAA